MEIKKEINDFYELADMVWSGAVDTIADIQNANKETEFMNFLEDVFCDEIPTDTAVNDFIWFERDYIYESLGLTENGELVEDKLEETLNDSIDSLMVEDSFKDFCGDCDECIFNKICDIMNECEALFEDYKNQVVTIDEIKREVEKETGMDIWE